MVEQDDVHNGSVLHPAAVVFPAVVAAAQAEGKTGAEVLLASIAGYEAGIRIGEFMGRSHYRVFHTTGTVGTLAAAAAVAKLFGLDAEGINQALGTAGTQAAGLWEFLRDAADSATAHRQGRRRWAPVGLARPRGLYRRPADPRRGAGHGGRHVERCQPRRA